MIEFNFDIYEKAFQESQLRILLIGGHALKAYGFQSGY